MKWMRYQNMYLFDHLHIIIVSSAIIFPTRILSEILYSGLELDLNIPNRNHSSSACSQNDDNEFKRNIFLLRINLIYNQPFCVTPFGLALSSPVILSLGQSINSESI